MVRDCSSCPTLGTTRLSPFKLTILYVQLIQLFLLHCSKKYTKNITNISYFARKYILFLFFRNTTKLYPTKCQWRNRRSRWRNQTKLEKAEGRNSKFLLFYEKREISAVLPSIPLLRKNWMSLLTRRILPVLRGVSSICYTYFVLCTFSARWILFYYYLPLFANARSMWSLVRTKKTVYYCCTVLSSLY